MKRKADQILKYLHALKYERSGILILLSIAASFAIAGYVVPDGYDNIDTDPEVMAFYLSLESEAEDAERDNTFPEHEDDTPKEAAANLPEVFDPNALSHDEWVASGLSPSQADGVLKYKMKSGGFFSAADLERVFVLPDDWISAHEDRLTFPEMKESRRATPKDDLWKEKEIETTTEHSWKSEDVTEGEDISPVEVNGADSATLVAVRGVGAKSAHVLLKYRDALGGFCDTDQFTEIWGLHPDVVITMKQKLKADSSTVRRIDLNSADTQTLADHPYISYKLARSIVSMREHKQGFKTRDDLKEHHQINDSLFQKLKPYLHVETSP